MLTSTTQRQQLYQEIGTREGCQMSEFVIKKVTMKAGISGKNVKITKIISKPEHSGPSKQNHLAMCYSFGISSGQLEDEYARELSIAPRIIQNSVFF